MRRRRKTRTKLGVSLFPFLAVLICTLGVLIVLLVLAVRSADVRATTAATTARADQQAALEQLAQKESELQELQSQNDLRMVQIDGLTDIRPEVLKRMAAVREHRGHLEQEIRALKQQAQKLARELIDLETETPIDIDSPLSDQRLLELEQKILTAKTQLAEKRLEAKTIGPVTYSIVPHAGSGGTFRRPIFIECTGDALVIQPLNIRLPKSEFTPPLAAGNMLDAALLAIRDYWQQYDLSGSEGTPYPLLVVRPGGAESYVIARRAMASWDDEFGYELVESEKQLEFGVKDEQLAERVEEAVADAKQRQQFVAAHSPPQVRSRQNGGRAQFAVGPGKHGMRGLRSGGSSLSSNERPGLTASGSDGGFVSNAGWERVAESATETQYGRANSAAGSNENDWSNPTDSNDSTDRHSLSDPTGPRSALDTYTDAAQTNRSKQPGTNQFNAEANNSASNISGSEGEPGGSCDSGTSCPRADLSLAKKRGSNWALRTKTPGATGYVRPIRLVCGPRELEIRSALGVEKRIPVGDDIASSIDPLVSEIWRQIESWGLSGERSYWKPELRISVLPGGELNFDKLSGLLLDSGVTVKESGQ